VERRQIEAAPVKGEEVRDLPVREEVAELLPAPGRELVPGPEPDELESVVVGAGGIGRVEEVREVPVAVIALDVVGDEAGGLPRSGDGVGDLAVARVDGHLPGVEVVDLDHQPFRGRGEEELAVDQRQTPRVPTRHGREIEGPFIDAERRESHHHRGVGVEDVDQAGRGVGDDVVRSLQLDGGDRERGRRFSAVDPVEGEHAVVVVVDAVVKLLRRRKRHRVGTVDRVR
jgi:hypothetical protein